MKLKNIAVFCASSDGKDASFLDMAYELGGFLAQKRCNIVYGGAKIGLMGAVANGAIAKKGEVYGVIPDFLKTKEVVHEDLTKLITVETMHERKTKMSELADGFIILPGGFGTMEEFFEILTWAQLGLHKKPIGVLNHQGYYDALIQLFHKMLEDELIKETNMQMVLVDDSIEGLYDKMVHYDPPKVKNWLAASKKT